MKYVRLGDLLLSVNLISQEQLDHALAQQKTTKNRLGKELISEGVITERQLIDALQMQLGVEFVDLSTVHIAPEMVKLVPKNVARKYSVVPVRVSKDTLFLAMSDPLNFVAIEEVKNVSRKRVIPVIATQDMVDRTIVSLYGNEGAARAIEEMKQESGDAGETASVNALGEGDDAQTAPTIRLVNSIIERAATERASDIHLEPRENELAVRMRIDGLMRNILTVPKNLQNSVISRLKIMGSMDIAERRVPQDGRANVRIKSRDIDLRMSTLPTIYGEKFVIRLLDKTTQLLDAKGIGLEGDNYEKYEKLLKNHSGVVLIVGPTGSGKSSTMYSMISQLNTEQVNLVTLEDPVEYNIDGINQVQINEKAGMTFASGLRAILRQDPDIIGVGEIRDGETAEIAMRAAITGHLVLSTIHTNDAVSTIDRLTDIGVAPYLTASALKGIISQRLVRRVCPHCGKPYSPSAEDLAVLGLEADSDVKFYHGEGCPMCYHTGYRGRTGVFEILVLNRETRRAIAEGASRDELMRTISSGGFVPMADACRDLVLRGVTTVEEARRTLNEAE